MKRSDFTGTGKVFAFTLSQYLKSKSTIAMMVLMLVLASVATFALASSSARTHPVSFNADRVTIINESGYELETEDVAGFSAELAEIEITITEGNFAAALSQLNSEPGSVAVLIKEAEDGGFTVTAYTGADSTVNSYTTSYLTSAASEALSLALWRGSGVSDEQLKSAFAPFSVESMPYNQYVRSQEENELPGSDAYFLVTYAYSIIVMILIIFSTSYIVRSVVEEKPKAGRAADGQRQTSGASARQDTRHNVFYGPDPATALFGRSYHCGSHQQLYRHSDFGRYAVGGRHQPLI